MDRFGTYRRLVPRRLRSRVGRLRRRLRTLRGVDPMHEFFDRLAPVYDDFWRDDGRFKPGSRPGWREELDEILAVLHALPPARTLDVGCGTGFLTKELPGAAVGLDQSREMLAAAQAQVPGVEFVRGDATRLPFPDGSFARVFASNLCTHLAPEALATFLAEARRVADEIVILDGSVGLLGEEPGGAPPAPDGIVERIQTRVAPDGSRYGVYKRWVTAERLCRDLGGGEVLHDGRRWVIVRTRV